MATTLEHKNILIVDDNHEIHEYLADVLSEVQQQHKGTQLDFASCFTGAELLQSTEHAKPDLIFMDLFLEPGDAQNGLELSEALWKHYPDLKIIFLTGFCQYVDLKLLEPYEQKGLACLYTKPFEVQSLQERVRNFLHLS